MGGLMARVLLLPPRNLWLGSHSSPLVGYVPSASLLPGGLNLMVSSASRVVAVGLPELLLGRWPVLCRQREKVRMLAFSERGLG